MISLPMVEMPTKAKVAPASASASADDDYHSLANLSLPVSDEVLQKDGTFTLCFWVYFTKSCKPGTVIRQVCEKGKEWSFLTLDHDRKLCLHAGSLDEGERATVDAQSHFSVGADQACTFEKWLHIGCEFNVDVIRLHVDGIVVGESHLKNCTQCKIKPGTLMCGGSGMGVDDVHGYTYYAHMLPQPTVTNHYVKRPPLELSLDGSTGTSDDHEVEEGGDGIWSVVGGKASCRRNFTLDVVLLDALGRSVHKDMEILATLVYADNGIPVEKPKDDFEAPLLTTFDGVEFPSTERPIKLVHGRASFKLKISQLSSKCDNRLFRVCFDSTNTPSYPFMRVFSRPIRCVSRNRNSRTPVIPWKKQPTTSMLALDATLSMEQMPGEPLVLSVDTEASLGAPLSKFHNGHPLAKRVCMDSDNISFDQPIEKCHVTVHNAGVEGLNAFPNMKDLSMRKPNTYAEMSMMTSCSLTSEQYQVEPIIKQETLQEERSLPSVTSCSYKRSSNQEGVSDFLVFKYCLENISSRATFLKGALVCFDNQDLSDFARRVSHYTSCEHNGYQILISKQLLQDGNEAWRAISNKGNDLVPWELALNHVEEHFLRLSCSKRRKLSEKDKFFLKQVTKCGQDVSHEDFDRLWYWIYPVCLALSKPQINSTWEVEDRTWIHGMVFREESEALLDPQNGVKPGMFIVRFPSTCSWPHPDAGGLIVSYIDEDFKLHHKLLNLDRRLGFGAGGKVSLAEILMSQSELSQPLQIKWQLHNSHKEISSLPVGSLL